MNPNHSAPDLDLAFAGAIYCDLVFSGVPAPEPGTEVFADGFTLSPGGAANRGVAGARLGMATALLATLGSDSMGEHIAAQLRHVDNLDLSYLIRPDGQRSSVTVALAGRSDRSFITYKAPAAPLEWPGAMPRIGALHVGVSAELPDWIQRARAAGCSVFGGVGWDSTGEWSKRVLRRLDQVDVFCLNDVEATHYTRTSDVVAAAKELGEYVPWVVVTRGALGALAFDSGSGELVEVPAVPVDVVDPTGAGDVFVAALMAATRWAWPTADRLRLAVLCASISVRTLGGAASAPGPAEISRYLTDNRLDGDWSLIRRWADGQHTG